MIAVINYGLGNLHSVHKALVHVGADAEVTDNAETILNADKVVLPGVGAFADGIAGLSAPPEDMKDYQERLVQYEKELDQQATNFRQQVHKYNQRKHNKRNKPIQQKHLQE